MEDRQHPSGLLVHAGPGGGPSRGRRRHHRLQRLANPKLRTAGSPFYGKGIYKLARGKTGKAKIKLTSLGKKQLKKKGKLVLTAQFVSKDTAGNATSATAKVTLKAKKPR